MSLDLDDRRVAMLREMGLRLLPPIAPIAPAIALAEVRTAAPEPAPVVARAPVAPIADVRPALDLDWGALQGAVAGCRACGLCETRHTTVFGVGPQRADWMVIGLSLIHI